MSKYSFSVRLFGVLFISFLFLLVVLLATELILRNKPKYSRSFFEYDPDLIWRLKQNYRGMKAWGDDHYPLRFNDQGFRGPDFQKEKRPEVTRIMALGDSYTAGLDVRFEDLFTTLLVDSLNATGKKKYELLNASSPAWGTDQEYIYWKREGQQYKPDYLLLIVAPNDIRELYQKKLVELQNGKIVVHPVEYPAKARRGWWWANRSSTFQYLQREIWETRYGHFWDIYEHYPVNFGKGDSTNWDLPLFLVDPFPEIAEARQLFKKLVAGINQGCREIGCKMLITIVPTKMEFDGTLDDPAYDPALVANLISEVATEEGIPYLNLHETVKNEADPTALFISWEFHLNEAGNAYLAKQLYPFFKANE